MTIHKEGFKILIGTFIILIILNILFFSFVNINLLNYFVLSVSITVFVLFLQFFRYPYRKLPPLADGYVIAPADGKVVTIEEVFENEYYKDKRIQVSIFMSPLNVHVNRYPISGTVKYVRYHPGLFLCAWLPKSSTDNEHSTVVVEGEKQSVLMRQIAGFLARRIVCYSKTDDKALIGADMGFIKFGSRVDVFLPLGTTITVKINDKVKGKKTVLAKMN